MRWAVEWLKWISWELIEDESILAPEISVGVNKLLPRPMINEIMIRHRVAKPQRMKLTACFEYMDKRSLKHLQVKHTIQTIFIDTHNIFWGNALFIVIVRVTLTLLHCSCWLPIKLIESLYVRYKALYSLVNSPHKGQWRGALMFSLICASWINGWSNNRETRDLRRHRDHYDVSVM